ncbi:MAG: acyl-CoA dehydrogenase family protein, partial [Firmicutes bacterium]|nr:acyl-CoA dehydrogenase family protein [Bacillota bacterium]
MDFSLTEEQLMLQKNVGDFAREELEPRVREIDEKGGFDWEIWRKLASMGLPGLAGPEAYGGAGGEDLLTQAIVVSELARYDFSSAANVVSNWSIIGFLDANGTKEHKDRYLSGLCNGDLVGSFAQTEPNAGSDVASLRTTARLEGDEYVLNGEKCFVTQGGEAVFTIVVARLSGAKGKNAISMFLVEKDRPGYLIGQKEDKLGYRGSTTRALAFDDCRIPAANLMGETGRGMQSALKGLAAGRIVTAAQALGQAQAALDASLK